eukprot:18210-Pleurochrysis_carterae.AAC.2
MGAIAGAGLDAPASGLRSKAQGTATLAMRLEEWKVRAHRTSAQQVHMRCGQRNGKRACEMERNGSQRHLPKCTSREGQNGNKRVSGSKR